MVCCFSHSVLTKAERDAVARLREQRAEGRVPRNAAHAASPDRMDPIVTFYNHHMKPSSSARPPARQYNQHRRVKPPTPPSLTSPSASGTIFFPGKGHGRGEKHGLAKRLPWHEGTSSKEDDIERRLESDLASSSISSSTASNYSTSSTTKTKPPIPECYSSSPNLLRKEASKLLRGGGPASRRNEHHLRGNASAALKHAPSTAIQTRDLAKQKEKDRNKMIIQEMAGNTKLITAVAQSATRRMTESPENGGRSRSIMTKNRLKEGSTAWLDALKTIGSWHKGQASDQERKEIKGQSSDEEKKENDKEKDEEKDKDDKESRKTQHSIGRLASVGLKKLDKVRHKLTGGEKTGQPSSTQPKADPQRGKDESGDSADALEESHNDAYFQELMRGD